MADVSLCVFRVVFQIMLPFLADVHFKQIRYYLLVGDSLLNNFELAIFK